MTVAFELNGQEFTAINGGPQLCLSTGKLRLHAEARERRLAEGRVGRP